MTGRRAPPHRRRCALSHRYLEVGLPALVGLAMMITIAPMQSWLGDKIGGIRKATTTVSDERVKLMTEILNGVRPCLAWTNLAQPSLA